MTRFVLLTVVLLALVAGCSDDTVTAPESGTGNVTISLSGEVSTRAVSVRWPNLPSGWHVVVQVANLTTVSIAGQLDLSPAQPTGTITGIPTGHVVQATAWLYAPADTGTLVTTGQSGQGTIVSGQNIPLALTLAATKPTLSNWSPTATQTSPDVTASIKATDIYGGQPTVTSALLDGVAISATPTVTGSAGAGWTFTWDMTGLADGSHAVSVTVRSTSHLTSTNGETTKVWAFAIDTTGGVSVTIEGVR